MNKLVSFFQLFQLGSQVLNPALWKSRQVNINMVGGLLLAVVNTLPVFGVPIPPIFTPDVINLVAGSVLAVANTALTIVTTNKLGISPDTLDTPKATFLPGIIAQNDTTLPEKLSAETTIVNPQAYMTVGAMPILDGIMSPENMRAQTNALTQQPVGRVGNGDPTFLG